MKCRGLQEGILGWRGGTGGKGRCDELRLK